MKNVIEVRKEYNYELATSYAKTKLAEVHAKNFSNGYVRAINLKLTIKIFLYFAFTSVLNKSNAQNSFPEYFKNIILAKELSYNQDYFQASIFYEKAYYAIPDKKKFFSYEDAILVFYYSNRFEESEIFFKELTCLKTRNTIVKEFSSTAINKAIIDSLYKKYKPFCEIEKDVNLYDVISVDEDSLFRSLKTRDQLFRETRDTLNKQLYLDSLNFVEILSHFKKFGITYHPGDVSRDRGLILTHLDNERKIEQLNEILLKGVLNGNLHPGTYAYCYDRCLLAFKKKPKYYWGSDEFYPNEVEKPNELEIKEINKNRNAIGLPDYPFWSMMEF
jgi:hypothetical protein